MYKKIFFLTEVFLSHSAGQRKTAFTFGFTLAEVLITLGIIGVVAAMTMPVLTEKVNHIIAVNRLKKMYTTLSQAMLYTVAKDGDYSALGITDTDTESMLNWYNNSLKQQLKITKECIDTSGCWAYTTKALNGATPSYHRPGVGLGYNIVVFNTVDGYSVDMDAYSKVDGTFGVNVNNNYVAVYVDINGNKNPNTIGKDIFAFVFTEKGFVPAGRDKTDEEVNADCSSTGKGYFCFEKIMRNGWEIPEENRW